jgi:hypothetical protein
MRAGGFDVHVTLKAHPTSRAEVRVALGSIWEPETPRTAIAEVRGVEMDNASPRTNDI